MNMRLENIALDKTIQCRKEIDEKVVAEYAERMTEGDTFPPVTLFGTGERAWIGDGWHRLCAARKVGFETIPAAVNPGGRKEALEYALKANGTHGLRRSNADKRRCVGIALREFGDRSSRALAEMCGVGHQLVQRLRGQVDESSTSKVTGTDGKAYPANKAVQGLKLVAETPAEVETTLESTAPPGSESAAEEKPVSQLLASLRTTASSMASLGSDAPDPGECTEIKALCSVIIERLTAIAESCRPGGES